MEHFHECNKEVRDGKILLCLENFKNTYKTLTEEMLYKQKET